MRRWFVVFLILHFVAGLAVDGIGLVETGVFGVAQAATVAAAGEPGTVACSGDGDTAPDAWTALWIAVSDNGVSNEDPELPELIHQPLRVAGPAPPRPTLAPAPPPAHPQATPRLPLRPPHAPRLS